MTPHRYQRIKCVFSELCELSHEQQVVRLRELRSQDVELADELSQLLANDASPSELLSGSALSLVVEISNTKGKGILEESSIPERIGHYKIIRKIAEGGMAIVFEAEQENPHRRVALKLIRSALPSSQAIRRFRQEVQVLGRLQHPGIARIYEAGSVPLGHQTVPFFAMEYIDGVEITDYVSSNGRDLPTVLSLVSKLCQAVQHAHQCGIIHRDLKPGNILVNESGRPTILDFGIARELSPSSRNERDCTQAGQLVGTISYMSPEQINGDPQRMNTRSDVYALGVVLFELLTGKLPHDLTHHSLTESARAICERQPRNLNSCERRFPGDLERIVSKALAKDPAHRYASAAALGDDVDRFLANQPIMARPPSTLYYLRKVVARHTVSATLLGLLFLVLIGASAGMSFMYVRASADAHAANQTSRFLQQMFISIDPERASYTVPVRDILDKAAQRVGAELDDQPDIAAQVRETLGITYRKLGLYEKAEEQLRAALQFHENSTKDPKRISSITLHLGNVLIDNGNFVEAKSMLAAAVQVHRKQSIPSPLEQADALSSLARAQMNLGYSMDAERLYRQALAIREKTLGPLHPNVAETLNWLAITLLQQGDFELPEPLLRRALSIRRDSLGPAHPDVAKSLNSLAMLLYERGDYAEAKPLYQEGLEASRQVFGPDHPHVATLMSNLGRLLFAGGDLQAAEQLHRSALKMRRSLLHQWHPDIASSLLNLAAVLHEEGYADKAEPLAYESLLVFRHTLGSEHPEVAMAMDTYAQILVEQGKLDAASTIGNKGLEILRRRLPAGHPALAYALQTVASIDCRKGNNESALPLLRESLGILRAKLTQGSYQTAKAELALGECLQRLGNDQEALPFIASAHATLQQLEKPQAESKKNN